MNSNPLDTLADEATTTGTLEAEEAAGGPPMPKAGQEGAATKPSLEMDSHIMQEPNGEAGEALHSEVGLGGGGVGDAAMAAVDERLDTGELPHTNGFVDDSQDKREGNELDYGRTANLTGTTEEERAPPVSMDVEQPAGRQVDEQDPSPEQAEGEAILPAPGQDKSVPLDRIDEPEHSSQTLAAGSSHTMRADLSRETSNQDIPASSSQTFMGEGPRTNGHAEPASAPQPSSEFQQTVPEPASSFGQASEQDVVSKLAAPQESDFPPFDASPAPPASVPHPAQAEAQPDPPQFMDALPDAPAPLPSQLVNHSVDTTDIHQNNGSSSISPDQQPLPRLHSPFSSMQPTIPTDAERVPPSNPETMPASSLPPSLISPSIAKRPFEPDSSIPDARDYFGDATEPQVKRQRISPSAAGGEGDADGEGEIDAAAEPEIQFGTADMGRTTSQGSAAGQEGQGKEETDMSMIDQSLDQSMTGESFSYDPSQQQQQHQNQQYQHQQQLPPQPHSYDQQQQQYSQDSPMLPPSASFSGTPSTAGLPPSSAPPAAPPVMPKEQSKYALSMLRTMKKKVEAGPFLIPVDPVGLGIPHYTQIVTQPMDLSTIEKKLQQSVYRDVEEFSKDLRQIWENCYLFNGQDSVFSAQARTLSAMSEKQLLKMPTLQSIQAEAKRSQSPNDLKRSKAPGGSKARRPSTAGGPRLSDSQKRQQNYEAEYDDYGAAGPSSARSQPGPKKKKQTGPGGMQMGAYGQQGPSAPNGNINNEQLKFCKEVIKELFKKQHSAFAYPFYEPVDFMALGIPDYPKVIRRPMDLGTIRRKIDSAQYSNASAFENDFKLLIQNCFTYNPPMTPVHKMGDQLQSLFYDRWQHLPKDQGWGGGYGNGGGDYYEDGNSGGFNNEQINLMQRQLELLTGNLEMLKNQQRGSNQPRPYGGNGQMNMGMQMPMQHQQMQMHPQQAQMPMHSPMHQPRQMSPPIPPQPKAPRPPPAPRVPKAPAKRKSSGSFSTSLPSAAAQASAPPKPRTTKRSSMAGRADIDYAPPPRGGRADSDYEDDEVPEANVTFDMKRELAEKIQEFDGPKLDKVVEIIRNSAPELLGDDNKEIELDIDMLDQRTLLKLYEYVVHPVGKGRQLKPKKNKVKGRNRGVDEVAEEERINALQAQLDAMEGNVAGAAAAAGVPIPELPAMPQPGRAADVASSSSEEEDDGSESESDAFAPSPQ